MKTIKLELSVKLLLGAIALGLFLNAFKDFPPKANADHGHSVMRVAICEYGASSQCARIDGSALRITD